LQLILFSTLIVALMVGGTLVILLNLRTRMM
jgi:cytochrome o ubiquinol oxidase operon protein cyoD